MSASYDRSSSLRCQRPKPGHVNIQGREGREFTILLLVSGRRLMHWQRDYSGLLCARRAHDATRQTASSCFPFKHDAVLPSSGRFSRRRAR